MMIAIDTDRKFIDELGTMLSRILPDEEFIGFTSVSECFKYVRDHEAQIVFFNIDDIYPNYRRENILYELRKMVHDLDFVLLGDKKVLDNTTALWSIQNRCSDYISKPLTPEKLIHSLSDIWFHRIPEQTLMNAMSGI